MFIRMLCVFFVYFFPTSLLCSFTKCPISLLELSPGKGITEVSLPFPYSHIAPNKNKYELPLLFEGNYTVLSKTKDVLVGPLMPCQLFYAYLPTIHITIVAHIAAAAQFKELLINIKKEYANADWQESRIVLFTNRYSDYDKKTLELDNQKTISFKTVYEGKTQEQELKYNKDLICSILCVEQKQVDVLLFDNNQKMGQYPLAALFVLIKNGSIYNTCPVKENYAQINFNQRVLPTKKQIKIFNTWLLFAKDTQPFFAQDNPKSNAEGSEYPLYNSLPFMKI